MPIPAFDHFGLLPPFLGQPTESLDRSPYLATIDEVAARFGHSSERVAILRGLIGFRSALREELGLTSALQWLDGSFVEDVESGEGRPPRDVDVLTIAAFPLLSQLTAEQRTILDPRATKGRFRCDAYTPEPGRDVEHRGAHRPHRVLARSLQSPA